MVALSACLMDEISDVFGPQAARRDAESRSCPSNAQSGISIGLHRFWSEAARQGKFVIIIIDRRLPERVGAHNNCRSRQHASDGLARENNLCCRQVFHGLI